MKMDERKQKVLMAVVQDFIATAEPVGSRTIAKKYRLGVSPATIRNEMADLEEQGYIEQPHTSAGRIPSQLGYRYYVDYLMQKKELSAEQEELIRRQFEKKVRDVGEVIQKAGQLLSHLTQYASIIISPQLGAGSFKHIQLILMRPSQAMVIVVMDNGSLHHRYIEVPESITTADMETISGVLNAKLQGLTIESIKVTLLKEIYFELARHKHILDLALELLHDLMLKKEDKIYLGGVFNMLNQPEFHNIEKVKTLLSIIEQEDLLRELLTNQGSGEGVTVRIGDEIKHREIRECSMITAPYSICCRQAGSIGVLGPTRMEYAKVVSIVESMTRNLSRAMERMILGPGK